MSCPDELTLDLWLADALPSGEASAVAEHVASCETCAAQQQHWHTASNSLQSALALDQDERAYLASLDLAATWRTRAAETSGALWGWLALLGVIATFLAWSVAAQPSGVLLGTANQVGVGTVLITNALGLLLGASQAIITISVNPALGLSEPVLAALALGVLFWPRIKSAPHFLQGVRS
jgi:hypothetical protein